MRSHTGTADRLDDALGEYRALERRLSAVLQGTGLTVDAWRVLRLLRRQSAVSMKEVLDATALPPASATRAVDTLVSLDYAFRRSDESDRRSVQALITPDGETALTAVDEMLDAEFAAWRQTEWIGWYFEYSGMSALINTFGGAPRRVLNTTFDYELRSTWDLKAHSDGAGHDAILNDLDAVDACLAGDGLGFIVLTGRPDFSDAADFDTWHRSLRGAGPAHDRSRRLKSAFTPLRLDAFHLAERAALVEQRDRGTFSTMIQGRQPDGSPRKPKLKIRLDVAASPGGCRVATRDLQTRTP